MGFSAYRQVGLTPYEKENASHGYTLINPLGGSATLLLDMEGGVVHRWEFKDIWPGYGRLLDNFPYRRIQPSQVLAMDIGDLRSVGLSRSKCKALHHLAESALVGTLPKAAELHEMSDDEIIDRLTLIWGIGRWTAEMLLIFYLGRPDVLPINDLGILKGYQRVRGYSTLPPVGRLQRAGKRWRPYRTVASWYLWRSLDFKK